jgi:membrane-associated protein
MENLIELILHTDDALYNIVVENIYKAYFILFLLIMFETGLIIFPFLPGDGLLFSAGVIAASTSINIWILLILLIAAAILGNIINYNVGKYLGFEMKKSKNYFIKNYLMKYVPEAEDFYSKHGGNAIIIGRFFPIIRTYIPFLAGIVKMQSTFFLKNTIIGAVTWIAIFLLTGFFVGEIEWVKNNYGLIFLGLIIITLIPFFYAILKSMFEKYNKKVK